MAPEPTECECGCGRALLLGKYKGRLRRFIHGHRLKRPDYEVDPATGCWVWTKQRDKGYGKIYVDGRQRRAHRVFYERMVGEVPEGHQLHHICDERACVNPNHLELLTHAAHIQAHAASPILGVTWASRNQRWQADLWENGTRKWIGYYETEHEAARAIEEARNG